MCLPSRGRSEGPASGLRPLSSRQQSGGRGPGTAPGLGGLPLAVAAGLLMAAAAACRPAPRAGPWLLLCAHVRDVGRMAGICALVIHCTLTTVLKSGEHCIRIAAVPLKQRLHCAATVIGAVLPSGKHLGKGTNKKSSRSRSRSTAVPSDRFSRVSMEG